MHGEMQAIAGVLLHTIATGKNYRRGVHGWLVLNEVPLS